MTSPKHLWSGDWEAESAAAARERARRRGQGGEPVAAEAPPPPRADPPRQPRPESPRQARPEPPAPRPVELRPKRPRPRLKPTVIPILVGLLVVSAAAYGLAKLADSGGSPSAAITQHTPWLGVTMESLPINRVAIAAVTPGGPADRAGLGPGDVIT